MKVLIVHAHPEPQSFNGGLTQAAVSRLKEAGHEVQVSDLYQMQWQPVSDRRNFVTVKDSHYYKQQIEEMHASQNDGFAADIKGELEKLEWCDLLVFQFPLWWFGLPAILKGWVDKVFAMGQIYGNGAWYDKGHFVGKKALLSVTIGGPAAMYTESGINGDINQILFPINHGIFSFVGFEVLPPFLVHAAARITQEEREEKIVQYGDYLLSVDKLEPIRYKTLAECGL